MEEFDLRKIFQVFAKRKWIIFVVVTIAVSLAVVVSILSPKIYESSGAMLVFEHKDSSAYKEKVEPQWYVNTQMELMKSQNVVTNVAEMWIKKKKLEWGESKQDEKLKKEANKIIKERSNLVGRNKIISLAKTLLASIRGKTVQEDDRISDLAGELKDRVKVTNKFGSNVFYMTVEAEDPLLAAAITNTMMVAYQNENLRLKQEEIEVRLKNSEKLYQEADEDYQKSRAALANHILQKGALIRTDYIKLKTDLQQRIQLLEADRNKTLDSQEKARKEVEIKEEKSRLDDIDKKMKEQEAAILKREGLEKGEKEKREIYEKLEKKRKQLENDFADIVSDIQISDWAMVPENNIKPKVAVNIIIALMASFMFGAALAFLLEFISRKIKNESDLLKASGNRVFCTFPLETMKSYANDVRHIPEQFRLLRTSIMASLSEGEKSLLITGTQQGNDPTPFVAANLALAFSLLEERQIILVDADFRNPRCHEMLGLEITYGLVDYLIGALKDLNAKSTPQPNLKLITVGQIPQNPAELLESKKMKEAMRMLEKSCDIVIFCSSSLALYPDASVLATMAHRTLLTATVDSTSIEDMVKIKDILSHTNAKVVGSVLTDIT